MEAIELARLKAAELHDQTLAEGADPWLPYEFALKAAELLDLTVESAKASSRQLHGGQAVLIRKNRLIVHVTTGTPFYHAFLAGHELGHAVMEENSEDCVTQNVEPTRSAEPSPVGMARVVDYSPKQRREMQMDLFAREFLLPRKYVARLYLEDGMKASEIAVRLGASVEVVAQQLSDALLLPLMPVQPEKAEQEYALNPEQLAAASHRGGPYLLEAGPGTGKTQTLTARVEQLLEEGVDPKKILVLTFSNKAAREMAGRIARKHKAAAAVMWLSTFHAFGLELIRLFNDRLNLSQNPRLLERAEAVELLDDAFPRLGLSHYRDLYDPSQKIDSILSAISRAKDEVVDHQRYQALANDMLAKAKSPEERKAAECAVEQAKLYACYEELKIEAGSIDFGDLVMLPVFLLENHEDVRQRIQGRFSHILVDEYQDVNRSSVRLLKALRPDGQNLWVVGDAKQSIYRFRGASSINMAWFKAKDFPNATSSRLERNYRSYSEMVDAFSTFAADMIVAPDKTGLIANRGKGGHSPEHRSVRHECMQTPAIADAIEEMRRTGCDYRDQAVLCTSNDKLAAVGQELESLGIPVLFLGSLFERPEIKELLSLLSLLTDSWGMGLVRAAGLPDFALSLEDLLLLLEHVRDSEGSFIAWLPQAESVAELSENGRQAMSRLTTALDGLNSQSLPWKALLTLLFDRTSIVEQLARSGDLASRSRGLALWQFLNFVREQPIKPGTPILGLLERVRRLMRFGDDRDLRQLPAAAQAIDAIRLMTIHGAKGLEFCAVHLPGMTARALPRSPIPPKCPPLEGLIEGGQGTGLAIFRAEHHQEQECLFYVALSRARNRLFFYSPMLTSNDRTSKSSPFLGRIGPGLISSEVTPSRQLQSNAESEPILLPGAESKRFKASQLARYEPCPRRFFYTHVLGVGGKQATTAFMRMHEAVRTVFELVVSNSENPLSEDDLQARLTQACHDQGLADHGYAAEYQEIAWKMLQCFLQTRPEGSPEAPAMLSLRFETEDILVRPDDVLTLPDGSHILRKVRTGHRKTKDLVSLETAALLSAMQKVFPEAKVQLVFLADDDTDLVSINDADVDAKVKAKLKQLEETLAKVRAGDFPAKPSSRICPSCPALFICGPVPPLSAKKNSA